MDIPEFARAAVNRARCRDCKIALCEHYAEFAGIFVGKKGKPQFGVRIRCPRCNEAYNVLLPGTCDWSALAVRVIHQAAGHGAGAGRRLRGRSPISDAEVTEMKRRLFEAKNGNEFLRLFGIEPTDPPAEGKSRPSM